MTDATMDKHIREAANTYASYFGELHGLPNRVDRIKSLGNAIVPQVAFQIFKSIEQTITL